MSVETVEERTKSEVEGIISQVRHIYTKLNTKRYDDFYEYEEMLFCSYEIYKELEDKIKLREKIFM